MKVAGIHASPVENAWNSCLHKALQDAAKEGVIEYVFSEGVSGTDYPRAMREYAEQGNKLIIGEAYAVEKEARQVAADYPDTAFVLGSSGAEAGGNFGVFGTWNHDGAYLAGMLAGKMTKSNIVGSVGAIPIPEVNMLINAFAEGVKAVNPGCKASGFFHRHLLRSRRRPAKPALPRSTPAPTFCSASASAQRTPRKNAASNRWAR